MSLYTDFQKGLKRRKKTDEIVVVEKENHTTKGADDLTTDFLEGLNKRNASVQDIAPVKTVTKADKDDVAPVSEDRTWFKASELWDDGYDFGDVTKTILGSGADLLEKAGAGLIGMGEKALDALAYVAPYIAQGQYYQNGGGFNIQADQAFNSAIAVQKEGSKEFIKKDLYDEEKVANTIIGKPLEYVTGIDTETDSVFGEKTDALAQSAGQLAGQLALQAVGVPWFVTSGVTSFGSEAENALNQGATMEEAGMSAAISAGAEVLSEKLFGGDLFTKGAGSDLAASYLSTAISNKALRTMAKLGIDTAGEGFEEVFSEFVGNLGSSLYREEDLGEILFSEEALDGYLEAMIGGWALGDVMSSVNVVKSNKAGIDYTTGLTKNEQAVVDKVYKDALAEAEKDGKVSAKDKTEIYNKVLEKMDKGYIPTDTIEEVLGGGLYKAYKDTVDSENALVEQQKALTDEYNTINKKMWRDMTGEEMDRREELKAQLADLDTQIKSTQETSQRNQLKSQLGMSVSAQVKLENDGKGSRLLESYNERARRGQVYEADLTQYDAKQRETIQKAIDSGILNNTNRTHEFVDIIAKISADKGVPFDFVNNQKLKESGFAVDGKTVNGYYSNGTIGVNIDSPKAWQSTVGHEITHVLEGTDMYNTLQETLFEYAKSKGEYDTRLKDLTELYKDIKDADVQKELTSDLVGDYLFTDADFIKNLSTKHRNIFEKVYDEIKYLYKVVTAGSAEARELEKVKKAFEDAYRADSKASGDTKYSLTEAFTDSNGKRFDSAVLLDTDFFDGTSPRNWGEKLRTMVNERATNDPFILPIVDENGNTTLLQFANPKDRVAKDGASNHKVLDKLSSSSDNISKLAVVHIDEIVSVSEENSPYFTNENNHQWLDENGWLHRNANVINQKNGNIYNLTVDIAKAADGRTILYATDGKIKKVGNVQVNSLKIKGSGQNSNSNSKVPQNGNGVKGQFSLSDSDGKQLTKEQQDYFKDSKMRDENGNLKVMYHGSQDAGFHVFDSSMSDDDTSFFFVDRNDVAASYSGTTETYEAKTIRSAEDMNNFLAEIGYDHYEAVERNGKFELLENGDHVATSDTAQGIYDEFCWYEGVGEGDANYKVYLNLKNPLVVDAKGRNWNNVSREYSQEVADRYHSLTAEEKAELHDLAGWGEISIFRDAKNNPPDAVTESAFAKLGDANIYDMFSIAEDNFSDLAIEAWAVKQMTTRDYAQKAKAEGYDGVIFNNIHDNGGYSNGSEGASTVAIAFDSNQIKSVANANPTADADIRYSVSDAQNEKGLDAKSEVTFSLSKDSVYMGNAIAKNNSSLTVDSNLMESAKAIRERIAARMNEIKDRGLVGLPEDIEGNTYIPNSSYDGTEENTTICPRSLASEAFVDAVSEYLGRPLTVEEQIYISQDLQGRSLTPECTYCYVATDRKAYRAFLGEYISQRDAVLQKVKDNPNADVSRSGELYKEFLNGRKDTNPMYSRFKMWVDAYRNGTPMVDASHLANMNKLMGDINSEFGEALKPQIVDAMKYAQSASWAKKRVNYVAYNGHILNWKQDRINKLNSHYGLIMYSFSDFHPAFVLENMQMITDASVRGLKMLGYTKDTDFVEIFAPSGMNINVSTFGFESGGNVYENNIIGAEWEKAKALREQYPNVGVTFVATNDTLVNWALEQDWVDVVIPYHLVRTGAEVAKAFNYTNYTSESADTKTSEWAKGDKKSIAPTEHNNDLATYLAALEKNHLKPRFERFIDNPNYMKLVNECRQSASESKPVQPVFNEEAAMKALAKLEANGYYQPIGGSVERMYEIAAEVAEDMAQELAPAMSLSNNGEQTNYGNYSTPANELRLEQEIAPVAETDDSAERLASLTDLDVPPETDTYYGEEDDVPVAPRDPFESRDFKGVGKRNVNAYMYDNPEVKPYFQMQARAMLGDLQNSVKGERWYNDDVYYESGGEYGWSGTERQTTDDIAYLLDMGYTYAQIEKGLNDIIEDNGAENNAMAKRIEFVLNDRLSKGYTDINGVEIPANEDYLNVLAQKQTAEAVEGQIPTHTDADAPMEDIAPVKEQPASESKVAKVKVNEEVKTKKTFGEKVRDAWDSTKKTVNTAVSTFGDKGWVFENLAKKTKNRELEAKYNFLHYSESRAQEYIKDNLMPIVERVKQTGKTEDVFTYVYHLHNIDRMSLETDENRIKRESLRENFKGLTDKQIESIAMEWIRKDTPKDVQKRIKLAREYIDANKGKNKPVFGDSVTADVSREAVKKYEAENPEFKELENAIVEYNRQLRKMLVDGNVISQKTADMWEKMYPHYVPIRRTGKDGLGVTVPLDTNKTGVNAPIKRATGGDSDIEDLFETMVMRTEQTFKAIAKNSFGVELMHTLDSSVAKEKTTLDSILDSFDSHEELLQEGKKGQSPTFTVFEDGKRVTFDITQEMYDALKPTSENLAKTYKIPNAISNIHRGLLTDKNPVFLATNAIKDVQDVLINSQHAGKTYMNFPTAIKELASKGQWFKEYMENGGEQNTYFDSDSKTFKVEGKGVKKWLNGISEANNFIERIPRLAEYIASRKAGRSIEVSMLDAARVTTNFAAGADLTKYLNRNGFTFLNASVQGAMQQARNVREANTNGLKGWAMLAGKVAGVGLAHTILNHLLWDDDEEYEELSDYVKQNYYIVAKTEDGKFIRIPKGRTMAVIQEAFTQMENLITGDDEADLGNFAELVIANLAPNNPLDNNILAPVIQAATNTTWYGEDLVPTRLQDVPDAEQYDEGTDAFSKWLGEKTDFSPYKINYLLNQYSGGIGDVFLPMMTPEAESGDDSFLGNIVAPWKDKFSTDSVMKNQNVSDFYDKVDELTVNANSSKATDEDVLMSKYMSAVNSELSDLYKQKREIQNSDLTDAEKYAEVHAIQEQINALARNGLNTYSDVSIDGVYATVGDVQFRWYEPGEDSEAEAGWKKLTDDQIEKQDEVTKGLGISPSEYWSDKGEYDFAYEYPEKYEFLNDNGVTYDDYKNGSEEFKEAWTWASKNPEKFTLSKAVASDVVTYRKYTSDLYDIKADKDENGKSITGSRKEKVLDYINNMDADYGEKIILFKSEYNADDTYNYEIIDYLNSREDISYEEMATILKELGFKVDSYGNITWD